MLISLGAGSAVAEEVNKLGETAKNIGERSKPRGGLGRGKRGGAWRHAFDVTFDAAVP